MVGRLIRTSIAISALALAACTHSDLRPDYVRQPSASLAPQADAPLVVEAKRLAAEHPNESGLRLLGNPIDALISRIALADRAKYSIDLQYYIYHGDATGKLLAQHLIMAADRGVRVRVLLDDLHEVGHDPILRALDAHPHIEIRVFNPRLPPFLDEVILRNLRLGASRVDLRVRRHNGTLALDTPRISGGIRVSVVYSS